MRHSGLDEAAEGTERRGKMTELKSKMTELKPCPFCGGEKLKLTKKRTKYKGHDAYVASIRCNSCHARGEL